MKRATLRGTALLLGLLMLGGGTMSYYEEALPSTMNPLYARTMVDRRSHELVFDRLYYRSAITSEIKSRIVESEKVLDDGKKLEMVLKDGIKWHDGQPLVAGDICFTLASMIDPTTPSHLSKKFREVVVDCAYDDAARKVTVTFAKKFYNPTERLSVPVLPMHVFQGNTSIPPDHEFSLRPVGSGPMKGSKGRREVLFNAVPNIHHNARIDSMSLAEGGDPLVQVRTLLNGGVQGVITVAPPLRPEVAATDDVALKSYDLRSWWFIALNTNKAPLQDVNIRQAVNHAIDRFELRRLTMGYDPDDIQQPCQFISGPFIPSSPYYNRGIKVEERSDLARTRERMEAAGAVEDHGAWVLGGKPVSLKIGMNAPLDLEARDLLNQIGNQLQAAGFGRQVHKISADDWSRKAVTGQLDDYDMLIGKWSFDVVEDVSPLFETRQGGRGTLNIFNYSDPRIDELVSAYENARTDTEAQDAFHELHAYVAEDLPYLFLWKLDTKSAWRMEVRGNTISPFFYFTEFDGWTYGG